MITIATSSTRQAEESSLISLTSEKAMMCFLSQAIQRPDTGWDTSVSEKTKYGLRGVYKIFKAAHFFSDLIIWI